MLSWKLDINIHWTQFTSPVETRYSPTEGELLAVMWALDNAKSFVLGWPNVTKITNHKPLLDVLNNRDLKRLCAFKEKT